MTTNVFKNVAVIAQVNPDLPLSTPLDTVSTVTFSSHHVSSDTRKKIVEFSEVILVPLFYAVLKIPLTGINNYPATSTSLVGSLIGFVVY